MTLDLREVGSQDDLDAAFADFLSLHARRWQNRTGNASFSDDRKQYQWFHTTLAKRFRENGWLGLVFLTVRDTPVAAEYNFIYGGKIYSYSRCFDPAWSHYRVGTVLQLMVLEQAMGRGITELDLLRGDESYKYHWTDLERRCENVAFWRSPMRWRVAEIRAEAA